MQDLNLRRPACENTPAQDACLRPPRSLNQRSTKPGAPVGQFGTSRPEHPDRSRTARDLDSALPSGPRSQWATITRLWVRALARLSVTCPRGTGSGRWESWRAERLSPSLLARAPKPLDGSLVYPPLPGQAGPRSRVCGSLVAMGPLRRVEGSLDATGPRRAQAGRLAGRLTHSTTPPTPSTDHEGRF